MAYEVEVQDLAPQPVATIRVTTTPKEIASTLATVLPEVAQYLQKAGARTVGPPFARYHVYERDTVDMEAGIPIESPVEGEGRVKGSELPGGTVATARYVGPYSGLHKAWAAIDNWTQENGREGCGAGWEVYITDPGEEPDSSKWETRVVCPFK